MFPVENEEKLKTAAQILKTMAHPIRLQIIQTLGRHGQLNVTTINRPLPLPVGALSQHLLKMTNRNILKKQRKGRETYYSLANPSLIDILNTLVRE